MRKFAAVTTLIFIAACCFGQPGLDTIKSKAYLFEEFSAGTVLLKSGSVEHAELNYNTNDQSILFINNGQYMILTGLETIDTAYIKGRKFIPANGIFYEVIATAPGANLYVSYSNTMKPNTAITNHGGTARESDSRISNAVTGVYVTRPYKGDFIVEIQQRFWIGNGKILMKLNGERQFIKFYPAKDEQIKKYVKDNNINFKNEEDLKKLLAYCGQ